MMCISWFECLVGPSRPVTDRARSHLRHCSPTARRPTGPSSGDFGTLLILRDMVPWSWDNWLVFPLFLKAHPLAPWALGQYRMTHC